MGTLSTRRTSLRDEVIKMKIKDELRNELVTKYLFNERMKSIDEKFISLERNIDKRFKGVDQKISHLEIKMDERFKRTDLKMNIIIGLSLLAMTLFNPKFMDILAKIVK